MYLSVYLSLSIYLSITKLTSEEWGSKGQGARAEKALLRNSIRWNSIANGIHNMSLLPDLGDGKYVIEIVKLKDGNENGQWIQANYY